MHANSTFAAGQATAPPTNVTRLNRIEAGHSAGDEEPDHFIRRDGKTFAGSHLIIDLWGARRLDRLDVMEQALREAVEAAGATLLHIHLHHFTPNGGISGVAVLAESHISVHTWPERDFAAFDIFMCGDAEPARAIPVLAQAFRPRRTLVNEQLRGVVDDAGI
jgi:S-adenosylmethionine decarboxylase